MTKVEVIRVVLDNGEVFQFSTLEEFMLWKETREKENEENIPGA